MTHAFLYYITKQCCRSPCPFPPSRHTRNAAAHLAPQQAHMQCCRSPCPSAGTHAMLALTLPPSRHTRNAAAHLAPQQAHTQRCRSPCPQQAHTSYHTSIGNTIFHCTNIHPQISSRCQNLLVVYQSTFLLHIFHFILYSIDIYVS